MNTNKDRTNVPDQMKQPEYIQCTSCKEIKPREEFKRKLSKAQSSALLRRPTKQNLIVTSKKCKACWNQIKRQRPLTRKEIRNKIESGDINAVLGENKIQELDVSTNAKKKRGMKDRWNTHRAVLLTQYTKPIKEQVRRKYIYWKGCKPEMKQWAELDYNIAKAHGKRLVEEFHPKKEPIDRIEDHYLSSEKEKLTNLFETIPVEVRAKLRRK